MQTAFFTERQDRENELLKKDIGFEKATRNYILFIFMLILIGTIVIVRKYKSEKKTSALLKELNIHKDKIFSIVGHDLKNPAGAINNFLELLQTDYDDLNNEERKEFIKLAYGASQTLINLLLELLEWGRLSRNIIKINKEPLNLNKIVKDTINLLDAQANQKDINIEYHDSAIEVYTDKNMISTVLRNFLTNAIKFTPRGGKIIISAYEDDQYSYISTKDMGIGINPELITDLFKFELTTTTKGTEDEPGTGIGLPVCKDFAERCDGTIRVESEEGKGSDFILVLPKNGNEH